MKLTEEQQLEYAGKLLQHHIQSVVILIKEIAPNSEAAEYIAKSIGNTILKAVEQQESRIIH